MRLRLASLVLAALSLAACDRSTTAIATPFQQQDGEFDVVHLPNLPSQDVNVDHPRRQVVRNTVELDSLWRQMWWQGGEYPVAPAVDFSRELVVAVTMGERSSGGYTIRVDSVYRSNGGYEVVVRSESPGASCPVTAALTAPADAVKLPGVTGAIRFREKTVVRDCS